MKFQVQCINPESEDYPNIGLNVQGVLLRRMKTMTVDDKPIIDLPPCTHIKLSAQFDADERAFYDDLKEQSKAVVQNLNEPSGGYDSTPCHKLCCHGWEYCPGMFPVLSIPGIPVPLMHP